jgi:gliding motility-associated-like protein
LVGPSGLANVPTPWAFQRIEAQLLFLHFMTTINMRNFFPIIILLALGCLATTTANAQSLILKSDTLDVPCTSTETVFIPVKVENFTNIAGLQFSMNWDTAKLDYQYCTNFNNAFQGAGFDTSAMNIALGRLTFAWTKIGGLSLPPNATIFSIAFKRIGGPAAEIKATNVPTEIVVLDPMGNDLPHEEKPGFIRPIDLVPPSITCPANVTVSGIGAVPVPNIAPASLADNCGTPNVGWNSVGVTTVSFPTDPDASNYAFNAGQSTVTYTANDAGGNTQTCTFTVTVESAINNDSLTIIANGNNVSCGQTFGIDITAANFDSIGGLQFSLNWNLSQLQFSSISNQNSTLNLNSSNFGTSGASTGAFTFAWTTATPGGITLADNAVLFTLNFTIVGNSPTAITFGNNPTQMVAFSAATFPPEEIGFLAVDAAIQVTDNVPPSLTCPANVFMDAGSGQVTAPVNNLQPLVLSDNCTSVPALTYAQLGANNGSGSGNANGVYNAGQTIVTYTALDGAGNTSTCSFSVNINAASALTLTLDTIKVDCQGGSSQASACITVNNFSSIIGLQFGVEWDETILQFASVNYQYPGLNLTPGMFFDFTTTSGGNLLFFGGNPSGWPSIPAGDTLFCINFDVLSPSISPLDFFPPYDAANTAFQSVPLLPVNGGFSSTADNSAPIITCPTVAPSVAPAGTCQTQVNVPLATATDACSGVQSVVSSKPDDIYLVGNTVVTYTATDLAGNTSSCTVSVVVTDNNPPTITCPASVEVNAATNSCEAMATWTVPSPVDQCNQVVTLSSSANPGSMFGVGISAVIYTATDGSGNTATCGFTVTVKDGVAPTNLTCPQDINVDPVAGSCTANVSYTFPTFSDNCDTDLDIDVLPVGNIFSAGFTTVSFTAYDDFGNTATCTFVVNVTNTTPPVLADCPVGDTVSVNGNTCFGTATWTEPTATDDCDTSVDLISSDLSGQDFPVGVTTVTYSAIDDAGNETTCSFDITVLEDVAPVILGCPDDILVFLPDDKCDSLITWAEPNVTDNCGIDVLDVSAVPGVFDAGEHIIVYTAIDFAGNTAECTFKIVLQDEIPPVFGPCPPSQTATSADNCPVVLNWTFPTATDNCTALTDSSYSSSHYPDDSFSVGITNVQIYVEDASGNFDTCQFTVTIMGTPPGISPLPTNADQVYYGCSAIVDWTAPAAIGFCGPVTLTSNIEPGDTLDLGTYTVTYTATPQSGQSLSVSFTVTVRDTLDPVINCPANNIVLNAAGVIVSNPDNFILFADTLAGCNSVSADFAPPVATDNCGVASLVQSSGPVSGAAFGVGSNSLVFTATDPSGNSKECVVSVEVQAVQRVQLMASAEVGCAGEIIVLTADSIAGATYTWTGPQMNYPNTRTITILSLSPGNAGQYTVFATVNGCITAMDTAVVYLATEPTAVDDVTLTINPGSTDTFNVFLNDLLSPAFDFEVTEVSPANLVGLTQLANGDFSYRAGDANVSFFYKVCSRTCPNLCDMATVTILVKDSDCSFVPNVFTPNGDSENETLKIPCLDGDKFRENSIVIYNQWGDKVYEASPYSNDDAKAWKGTLNGEAGKDLPDGVYYYIFKPGPLEKAVKGFIEIYR